MEKKERRTQSLALLYLTVILLAYSAMLIHMAVILIRSRDEGWVDTIISFIPQLVMIVSSLMLQFFLRINHRTHSQEGALLPLLFSFIALESTMILPTYFDLISFYFIPSEILIYLSRFSVLGTAVVFLFASLQYYGTNLSRSWAYLGLSLAAVVYIIFAVPLDSNSEAIFTGSAYGRIVVLFCLILNITAAITYAAAVVRDRATHSVMRSVAFILLIIGNIISFETTIAWSIVSVVSYLSGIIILGITAKNSF